MSECDANRQTPDSLIIIGDADLSPVNIASDVPSDIQEKRNVDESVVHSSEPVGVSVTLTTLSSASPDPNSFSTPAVICTKEEPQRSTVSSEVIDKIGVGCRLGFTEMGENLLPSASKRENQEVNCSTSSTDINTTLISRTHVLEDSTYSDVAVEPNLHIKCSTNSVVTTDTTSHLVSDDIVHACKSESTNGSAATLSESDAKPVSEGTKLADEKAKSSDEGRKPADDGTKSPDVETKPADDGTKPADEETKPADVGTKTADEGTYTSSDRSTCEAKCSGSTQDPRVYHVKWITFRDSQVPVITQSDNGSCPLLAILNTQFLLGKTTLQPSTELITSNDLFSRLADCIFSHAPKNLTVDSAPNYEKNVEDALAVFPSLETGLDVNVKFTGVSAFEFTSACTVFDLLDIPLYHGWLVDPQLSSTVAAVGSCSYNQLVEKIIEQKGSKQEHLVTEALLAEEFLTNSATQLTYHGLSELSSTLEDGQICVLFRNNHFSTLFKLKNELFVLVTDISFLAESNIVWETLSNVEGDGNFVDSNFRTYSVAYGKGSLWDVPQVQAAEPLQPQAAAATSNRPVSPTVVPINSKEQIDHDYMVALSLEQDDVPGQAVSSWPQSSALNMEQSDRELAVRLQEEEDAQAMAAAVPSRSSDKLAQSSANGLSDASGGQAATGGGKDNTKNKEKEKEKDKSTCNIM